MNGLQVLSPGMLSLIQDLGRYGVARHGLSVGGPADLHAACWANKLLGNSANAPVLEITMGNAVFRAETDMTLSITGADTRPTIDDMPISSWRSFVLQKGQVLKLGYAKTGFRVYLAVAGGFDVPTVFGSAATVIRNNIGGLSERPGSALKKGDIIPIKAQQDAITEFANQTRWVPRHFIPQYSDELCLSVIESYQSEHFSPLAKQAFYGKPYQVTDKSDRMGIRLNGQPVSCEMTGVISEGIAIGSIQIPANGQPIILLNDRQTLGGYPKIGCVSKMSLMKLGQARPGSKLNFYRGDIDHETKAYCRFMEYFGV